MPTYCPPCTFHPLNVPPGFVDPAGLDICREMPKALAWMNHPPTAGELLQTVVALMEGHAGPVSAVRSSNAMGVLEAVGVTEAVVLCVALLVAEPVGGGEGVAESEGGAPGEKDGVGVPVSVALGVPLGVPEGEAEAFANSPPTEKSMPQASGVVTRTVYTHVGPSTKSDTAYGAPQVKYTCARRG